MKLAGQLVDSKGHDIYSIGPNSSVFDSIKLMAEKSVGALLVMKDGELKGIVTERDYARKVALKGRSSRDMKTKEIMTSRVAYVRPEQSVQECMALMTEKRIRHLPVVDGGQVLGIISIGDLVKSIIEEQQHVIEQLEQYISR